MKSAKFFLHILLIALCLIVSQTVSADNVPLKKDDPTQSQQPRITSTTLLATSTSTLSPTTSYPVNVDFTYNLLTVSFDYSVGNAIIAIETQDGVLLHSEILKTNKTLVTDIDTSDYTNGTYLVRISYGTTKLVGTIVIDN